LWRIDVGNALSPKMLPLVFVSRSEWQDPANARLTFLMMTGNLLACSIADGLALGLIADPLLRLCSGRGREVGWLGFPLAALLLLYFIAVRGRIG
jgi:AGZA family xanthine/uracil permease-like MFS transporter